MIIHPKLETPVTAKYAKYIVKQNEFEVIKHFFFKDQPKICVIDSETTGLHLKKDKPFLWVFGWLIPKERRENGIKGRVFAFEHSSLFLLQVLMLAKQCNVTVGHNIKYDMHMMVNGGVPEKTVLDVGNWTDTMTVCRLIFEAVSDRDGGDNLSLKYVASKYIDFQATIFEDAVKRELRKINDERRNVLIALLKPYKGWGIGKIEDVYKVKTRGSTKIYTKERKKLWEEVPPEIEEVYFNWIDEYPLANYSEVPRDVITEYVHSDGIYTLEIAERGYPVVYARNQQNILKRENALIPVLFKQERLGMKVDLDYLRKCDALLRQEIYRNYKELWELTGRYFTVSQDQVIADYYEEQLSTRPESTDKAFLKKQKGDRVAKLISRLRRLEKWQSTYISRILEVAEYDGRFYTQFNPNGTVSGRISSDAQQFPKERILTEEGEEYEKIHGEGKAPQDMEIFCPRRAFIPDEKPYSKIAYFDLSQIELRVQANYTILLKRPDKNLCRAYMPLDCTHYQTGETYKFDEPGQRARWNEKQPDGRSAWIIPETGEPWVPTDVHSETAHNTLIALGYNCIDKYKMYKHMEKALVDELSFKEFWRKKGKIFNFMRNYGGGKNQAMKSLELSEEVAEAMVTGWSASFPEVAHYQNMVIKRVERDGYAENMYGRRYYLSDTNKAYKVGNYLVQGSCADMLKEFMIRIDLFLSKNNCKTRMLLNVHDEIQLLVHEGEEWIFPYIKKIMENVPWMLVPVEVGLEVTENTWADKKEVVA